MKNLYLLAAMGLVTLALGAPARAHITPPVVLASDRDAVAGLLAGARRFFVREVRLTPAERQVIRQESGWSPEEDFYRFYIGRDAQDRMVAATVFLSEFTIHGPVRVAVALGPDGKVKGSTVVEVSEETYAWVKPLVDRQFTSEYVGRDARSKFAVSAGGGDSMVQFYGQIIASLIQRAAILYEVGVIKRGDAAGLRSHQITVPPNALTEADLAGRGRGRGESGVSRQGEASLESVSTPSELVSYRNSEPWS